MSEQNASLLDAIQLAKKAEQEAAKFYAQAAEKATHSAGKRLFDQLAAFESFHYLRLSELEESLRQKGAFIGYEGKDMDLPPVHTIKSPAEPDPKTLMEIISMAIEAENKAEASYRELAEMTADADGRAMFLKFADEEKMHARILKRAYWSLNDRGVWDFLEIAKDQPG